MQAPSFVRNAVFVFFLLVSVGGCASAPSNGKPAPQKQTSRTPTKSKGIRVPLIMGSLSKEHAHESVNTRHTKLAACGVAPMTENQD